MNKNQLAKAMSDSLQVNRYEAYQFIDLLLETMIERLLKKDKIVLSNFGTLKAVVKKSKKVMNPNTRDIMAIPSYRAVKFVPAEKLKNLVNGRQKKSK